MTTPSAAHGPLLSGSGLRIGYDETIVVDDVDLEIPRGSITALVGPNASGKSTLLRGLARLLPVTAGQVVLDGHDLRSLPTREVARIMGILPQGPVAPEGITVADLVSRGRHPHHRAFRRASTDDLQIVAEALIATGTHELADRPVDALSGGQRQRVWIAMTLAQQTDLLLLDEPTTFLDIAHQIDVLDLLAELRLTRGKTILMVLHDLEQAAAYADRLVVLSHGRIVAQGAPASVLTADLVSDVFGLEARIFPDPDTGVPLVLPRGRHMARLPVESAAPEHPPAAPNPALDTEPERS